jgi:hypothetical protein
MVNRNESVAALSSELFYHACALRHFVLFIRRSVRQRGEVKVDRGGELEVEGQEQINPVGFV